MANPLIDILNKGLAMFSKAGGQSVVGIDIGASSIKVVQLKKKGGSAVLETYGELSLGPYAAGEVGTLTNLSQEKLSEAVADAMKAANVTTSDAALSIPSAASLIFVVELPPSIDEKQLPSIVPTEARKYIPVPIAEVTLDYWQIPKKESEFEDEEKKGKTEVLVSAIHNDTIKKYREILKAGKLQSNFFEIEVFSAIRSTFGHELSPVMIMDFGASKTKIAITEYGIVKSFHIINRGSADISTALMKSLNITWDKAEDMKREYGLDGSPTDPNVAEIIKLTSDYVLSEANSVLLNYERKYNRSISKVILTGGGALLKGFSVKAADNFRSEVISGDPFGKVEVPTFLTEVLKNIGPEFAVSVGLALRRLM
jgi:type IV pilus assembly protein PilM